MENINAKDRNGHTALTTAAKLGKEDVVATLLEQGADIASITTKGRTALHYAASNGHTAIVQLLISKGAKVNVKDVEEHTPLMLASIYGFSKTVQALLENGANPSLTTKYGTTAAQYAENNQHPITAALLKKSLQNS